MSNKDKKTYLTLCKGGVRKFKLRKDAMLYASKKELQGYSVRVYRIDDSDADGFDVLYCVYYTGVEYV